MGFQEALIDWYKVNHRKLPWRETKDPYKIWLSEIMCQQTQVATVIEYYNRFIQAYPTVYDLSKAPEDEVYKLWEGLGYYSRAKRLMLCASQLVNQYGGMFPKDYKSVIKLPGIGPYTAGAVLSIAFGVKVPAIDGNVMRVYSRLYKLDVDVSKPDARKYFAPYVESDLPDEMSEFNQGLMELGATICTPISPKCTKCPVNEFCKAYELGIEKSLPIKTPKKKKKTKTMLVAYITNDNKVMIEKRGTEGLLANLWGFPILECNVNSVSEFLDWIEENYDQKVTYKSIKKQGKHVFTHLIWEMKLLELECELVNYIEDPIVKWVTIEELQDYALPTAFKKLLR